MNKSHLVGVFKNTSQLETKEGLITLTTARIDSNQNIDDNPLVPAVEREGMLAIVSGFFRDNVLYNAQAIEVSAAWISQIMVQLIQDGELSWDDMIESLRTARDLIIGPIQVPTPTPTHLPLCALVVGHRESSRGAVTTNGISEWDFNREIAEEVKRKVSKASVEIVFRDDNNAGYQRLPRKINAINPKFIVSLHFNSAHARATGTETLYFHRSTKGHRIAKIMQRKMVDALGLRNRYTKGRSANQRGGTLLKYTNAACIITEPFFGSNPNDVATAFNKRNKLINAYANAIDEIAVKEFG